MLSYNLCDSSESLNYFFLRESPRRTFLVVQWIEIHLQWDTGLIPDMGIFYVPQSN